MKIQSHELQMQSQHLEYKSLQKSELSFSTFLYDTPQEIEEPQTQISQTQAPTNQPTTAFNWFSRIDEIIQHLLGNLKRMQEGEASTNRKDAVGFTHVSLYQKYEEHESVSFSTKGIVKTDKGEFNLDFKFNMSRDFVVENRIDIYSEFDPLIMNLDGEMPQLSDKTFSFDLDNDGKSDQISKLKGNNGFLVYDKNHDGKVNQGSELFGTKTGNGFGELAEYDKDKNGWIDSSDSIFDKLQIWFNNEESDKKELVGLGEAGVGAIFLGSNKSEFTYKTEQNTILGKLKSSGLFLNEDGTAGNIAQIDLTSHDEPLGRLLQA